MSLKAAILAAGKSRRLSIIQKPKALATVQGQVLIKRTLRVLEKAGFSDIYIVIRHDSHRLRNYIKSLKIKSNVQLVYRNSQNPFYSLIALEPYVHEEEILVFNVDAYFDAKDLYSFVQSWKKGKFNKSDMIMWALDTRKDSLDPAYMKINTKGLVCDYGKDIEPTSYEFGQIRCCHSRILELSSTLRAEGVRRTSDFIKYLIKKKFRINIFSATKYVYDIDTPQDLERVQNLSYRG